MPLGYTLKDRSLIPQEDHAELVRFLFRRYLELGSVRLLKEDIDRQKINSPVRQSSSGRTISGRHFSRGHLYRILSNPVYIGRIVHRGKSHHGQYLAIVAKPLWNNVQQHLKEQTLKRKATPHRQEAFLTGRLYDDAGNRMSPSWSSKGDRRWRYYVSQALLQGEKDRAGTIQRISAPVLEKAIMTQLAPYLPKGEDPDTALNMVEKVTIGRKLTIATNLTDASGQPITIDGQWKSSSSRRHREILHCEAKGTDTTRPMRTEAHGRLLSELGKAHRWLEDLMQGRVAGTQEIAEREGCTEPVRDEPVDGSAARLVGAASGTRLAENDDLTAFTKTWCRLQSRFEHHSRRL